MSEIEGQKTAATAATEPPTQVEIELQQLREQTVKDQKTINDIVVLRDEAIRTGDSTKFNAAIGLNVAKKEENTQEPDTLVETLGDEGAKVFKEMRKQLKDTQEELRNFKSTNKQDKQNSEYAKFIDKNPDCVNYQAGIVNLVKNNGLSIEEAYILEKAKGPKSNVIPFDKATNSMFRKDTAKSINPMSGGSQKVSSVKNTPGTMEEAFAQTMEQLG